MKGIILALILAAVAAWAQNPPYTITQTKDARDAAALNQDIRALADSIRKSNATLRAIPSFATAATGGPLCLNASRQLSKCTSAVDGSGNCTCP